MGFKLKHIIPKKLTLKHLTMLGLVAALLMGTYVFFFRRSASLVVEMQMTDLNPLIGNINSNVFMGRDIRKGDVEKNAIGSIYATVLDIKRYPIEEQNEIKNIIYLKVKLKTVYSPRQDQHAFKGKPVLIGSELRINLNSTLIEGLVTSIEGNEPPVKQRIVQAQLNTDTMQNGSNIFGVQPWIPENISVGDTFLDMNGKPLAVVLDKIVKPADFVVTTALGNTLLAQHPYKKKVILKLNLTTEEIQGVEFYLHRIPVRIGSNVPIFLKNISISPQITAIEE